MSERDKINKYLYFIKKILEVSPVSNVPQQDILVEGAYQEYMLASYRRKRFIILLIIFFIISSAFCYMYFYLGWFKPGSKVTVKIIKNKFYEYLNKFGRFLKNIFR